MIRFSISPNSCFGIVLLAVFSLSFSPEVGWGQAAERRLTQLSQEADDLFQKGRPEEGAKVAQEGVDYAVRNVGERHPYTATMLHQLAILQWSSLQLAEAESSIRRAIEIREEKLGDHPDTASSLEIYADLIEIQGRYGEVETMLLRALEMNERLLGDHVATASALNGLAVFYQSLGRYDEALPLAKRCLRITEAEMGPDHPRTAVSLNNLASLFEAQGDFEGAEKLYRRCLEIMAASTGEDSPRYAQAMDGLANLYLVKREWEKALPLFEKRVEIWTRAAGPDHLNTANTFHELAFVLGAMGKFEEAERLFLRSLELKKLYLPPEHKSISTLVNQLARVYEEQGRREDARVLVERGLRNRAAEWQNVVSYFSERECLTFQQNQFEPNHPLNPAGRHGDGRLAALAQLWFKGAVVEAIVERKNDEVRLRATAEGRVLQKERDALAPRYRALLFSRGSGDAEVQKVAGELEALEKRIAIYLGSHVRGGLLSIGVAEVQSALRPGQVLAETFRYAHEVETGRWQARYATTLIRPTGDPIYVSHGEAGPLEDGIRLYRGLLQGEGDWSRAERDEALRGAERLLYGQLLAPIEEHLGENYVVIFSPDAQLHFLPLAMLRNESGTPFGKRYDVRFVSSGRDLLDQVEEAGENRQTALVVGNPDFENEAPRRALAASSASGSEVPWIESSVRSVQSGERDGIFLGPLPGTEVEASGLAKKLGDAGYEVTVLRGDDASEERLLERLPGSDLVHLATHGFFLPEIPGGQVRRSQGIQNPMYRSGLALSGAQSTFDLWFEGRIPPLAEDGILLASEVAALHLQRTRLVVLSACETGAGEALDGEGVVGLRRAFYTAGVRHVVMTLWPVDDAATVEVMDAFYDKVLQGVPAPRALHEVQQDLLPIWIQEYGEAGALYRLAPFLCASLGPLH